MSSEAQGGTGHEKEICGDYGSARHNGRSTFCYCVSTCLCAGPCQPATSGLWHRRRGVRINVVKSALQLTPDQEKFWPPIEEAIRNRAKNRQTRIANAAARVNELRDRSPVELLRDRDPINFMRRRADALAQRSADLKKLADAWQPLYATLSQDQRRRMAFVTVFVLREVRSG